jgi:hypothetical protein
MDPTHRPKANKKSTLYPTDPMPDYGEMQMTARGIYREETQK